MFGRGNRRRSMPPPFLLPPLIGQPPEYFGGSSEVIGYTWHLSVVNAGRPRSMTPGEVQFQLTSAADRRRRAGRTCRSTAGTWTLAAARRRPGARCCARKSSATPMRMPVTGDFNGDGVTDIGVFVDGQWFLDLNGNGKWDEGDLWAKLGTRGRPAGHRRLGRRRQDRHRHLRPGLAARSVGDSARAGPARCRQLPDACRPAR